MTTKRASKRTREKSNADAFSHSALKLIDQAASLLKQGVKVGAKQGASVHQEVKKKALSLVNAATRHLNKAIERGSGSIRKGLRKL